MKLIISEKPSQAKEYSNALGGFTRKDGYFESSDTYIVWCYGHLIELEKDIVYREAGKWSKSYLPLLPEKFKYCIGTKDNETDEGKAKQIELIKNLASQSTEIINATDADREGELIFLYVYNYLGLKLPYSRLWISSLTEGDIKKGFSSLLRSDEVKNLGKAAHARAIADWMVGINCTQAATLQLGGGKLLPIGRVQTSILKIICERYLKNKAHEKSYTYKIKVFHKYKEHSFFSETDSFDVKEHVELAFKELSNEHILKEKEQKDEIDTPPLLHSIDSLIIEANKFFSMSGDLTLKCAQSLYEKKLTTYPRTDSQYINKEGFEKLKGHINETSSFLNFEKLQFNSETPKSVNESKITGSHDAIVPTGFLQNFDNLDDNEVKIYTLITLKVLQSFSTKAIYNTCKYTFDNNGIQFYSKTNQLVDLGWKKYILKKEKIDDSKNEKEEQKNIEIEINDNVGVENKEIKEIESKPPALFTDASLTPVLKNIGKFLLEENPRLAESLKDKIDLKSVQIGTQATRPSIMERLKSLKFIELAKKNYIPTEVGLNYYNSIKNLQVTNIGNTAVMEYELKEIAEGKMEDSVFYNNLNNYITSNVEDIFKLDYKEIISDRKSIGTCPKCKNGNIYENSKAYGCSEYKNGCDFVIWKTIAQKTISEKNIIDLIVKQKTSIIKGFKNKAGKKFDAHLVLKDNSKIEFFFPQTKK